MGPGGSEEGSCEKGGWQQDLCTCLVPDLRRGQDPHVGWSPEKGDGLGWKGHRNGSMSSFLIPDAVPSTDSVEACCEISSLSLSY
jgi:hypothetical protein